MYKEIYLVKLDDDKMRENTFILILGFMLILAGIVTMIAIPIKPVASVDVDIGINLWWLIGPFFVGLGILILFERLVK
ncbi:MAG: hypothetical protein ACOCZJ_01725 [Thermoplasmatota archaeon]